MRRRGFTLVELLIVLVIVALIAAATLPVVVNAMPGRYARSAAQVVHGALAEATPRASNPGPVAGVRLVADDAFPIRRLSDGTVDPAAPLAFNRIVPLAMPPGIVDGAVAIHDTFPAGFAPSAGALILEQEVAHDVRYFDASVGAIVTRRLPNDPTAWAWRARVGDRVEIGVRTYTICGPVFIANPEGFVNYPPAGTGLDRGDGPAEWLLLVNGLDDDGDGIVDNGWNGIDDDGLNGVDDAGEWSEKETWGQPTRSDSAYVIRPRPAPVVGSSGVTLSSAVIDATGWDDATPGRSRVVVDRIGGFADLIAYPDGRFVPSTPYAPTAGGAMGPRKPYTHLWITPREQVAAADASFGVLVTLDGRNGRTSSREVAIERRPDGTVDPAYLAAYLAAERGE